MLAKLGSHTSPKISRPADLADRATGRSATAKFSSAGDLEDMARALESCGNFRLLRRLRPRVIQANSSEGHTRRAIFLDVETTGLDAGKDAVVELAMLPFDYDIDGRIVTIGQPFVSLP